MQVSIIKWNHYGYLLGNPGVFLIFGGLMALGCLYIPMAFLGPMDLRMEHSRTVPLLIWNWFWWGMQKGGDSHATWKTKYFHGSWLVLHDDYFDISDHEYILSNYIFTSIDEEAWLAMLDCTNLYWYGYGNWYCKPCEEGSCQVPYFVCGVLCWMV